MPNDTRAAASSRWLRLHAVDQRGWLMLSAMAGVAVGLLTVLQMLLLAWIISRLLVSGDTPGDLARLFVILLLVLLCRAVCQWVQESAGLEASLRIRQRVRTELLDHLDAMGPVRVGAHHSAALASQLVEQVEALDGYFARFLPQLWLSVAIPLLILLVVLWLDWLAALFLLFSAPLIPLFMALVGMGAERLNRDQFVAVSRLSGHFLDRVRGIATLQLFSYTARATQEVHAAADRYRQLSMRTLRVAFLSSAVLEFFSSVAIAAVAIYVGFALLGYFNFGPAQELTLFSGLLVLLLAPEFFQPLRTLAQHYHDRAAALGAADQMVQLLGEPVRAGRPEGLAEPETALVALRRVTLEHPGRGRVLGPLNIAVQPGEILVVIGPSGAGKSSLLQLLAGFVVPDQGERQLRRGVEFAWMGQHPPLIQGSLAENLRLAAPQASDAELWHALERAELRKLVEALPKGLDTPIGERGVGLSGGQAQRLALARIFLSAAELVLLDEPTVSLDEATEEQVIRSLQRLVEEGRTLVIATHHTTVMAMASRQLSLQDGRLMGDSDCDEGRERG